jgi:hypothetical protein
VKSAWRYLLVVAALMAGSLLLAACGGGREVPPPAVLKAGDARQTGGLGTFCWGGLCVDAFAVVAPSEPLAVAAGEPLILELGFDPTEVYLTVWRPNQGEVVGEPWDHAFTWRGRCPCEEPVLEETPPPTRKIELRLDLPPGTYIVGVSTYAAGGSASYGFHLEVVP